MPKICFWNMRHLGLGSDQDRKDAIETVLKNIQADYTLFCELTTTSVFPEANKNLTYRKPTTAQLCYGCIDADEDNIVINKYTPFTTPEYEEAKFKGGTDFTQLASRCIGFIGNVAGVDVYVIHAPSGGNGGPAKKVMSFAACHLNHTYGNNAWLIIGDFNVEPDVLESVPVGINLGDLIHAPDTPTYRGPKKNKTYDYVLCNFDVTIKTIKAGARRHNSDHYPITVEW